MFTRYSISKYRYTPDFNEKKSWEIINITYPCILVFGCKCKISFLAPDSFYDLFKNNQVFDFVALRNSMTKLLNLDKILDILIREEI